MGVPNCVRRHDTLAISDRLPLAANISQAFFSNLGVEAHMTETKDAKTVRLMIHGTVQNVFYRASAMSEAERRNLSGWIRNRHDGTVEAVVSGPEEDVDAFIGWTREGPPNARVVRVEIAAAAPPDSPGFIMRPTA